MWCDAGKYTPSADDSWLSNMDIYKVLTPAQPIAGAATPPDATPTNGGKGNTAPTSATPAASTPAATTGKSTNPSSEKISGDDNDEFSWSFDEEE